MGTKWLSLPDYVVRNVFSNFKEQILNLRLITCASHMDCNGKPQVQQNKDNSIVFKRKSLEKEFIPKDVCTKK